MVLRALSRHAWHLLSSPTLNASRFTACSPTALTSFSTANRSGLNGNLEQRRYAGHNKWSNIKRGKAKVDAKRAVVIAKACKQLQAVLRRSKGEFDPKFNTELAKALQACQDKQVPKETVQRQIDRAKNAKLVAGNFVVKGPGALVFLVEVFSDSLPRCAAQMRTLIRRHKLVGFSVLDDTDADSFFEARSTVTVALDPSKVASEDRELSADTEDGENPKTAPLTLDAAEEIAIEYGAQEVFSTTTDEDVAAFEFICDPKVMTKLVQVLNKMGHAVLFSDTQYLGIMKAPASDEMQELVAKFEVAAEELEEFERLHSNIEAEPEEQEMAQVSK